MRTGWRPGSAYGRKHGTPPAPSPPGPAAPESIDVHVHRVCVWTCQSVSPIFRNQPTNHTNLLTPYLTFIQRNHRRPAATCPSSSPALCFRVAADAASPARASRYIFGKNERCETSPTNDTGNKNGEPQHPTALPPPQKHTHVPTYQHRPLRGVQAPGLVHQVDDGQTGQHIVLRGGGALPEGLGALERAVPGGIGTEGGGVVCVVCVCER